MEYRKSPVLGKGQKIRISNSILILQETVPWNFTLALRKSQLVWRRFISAHLSAPPTDVPSAQSYGTCSSSLVQREPSLWNACQVAGGSLLEWRGLCWEGPCIQVALVYLFWDPDTISSACLIVSSGTLKPFPHTGSWWSCELFRKAVGSCMAFLDVSLLNSLAHLVLSLEYEEMLRLC